MGEGCGWLSCGIGEVWCQLPFFSCDVEIVKWACASRSVKLGGRLEGLLVVWVVLGTFAKEPLEDTVVKVVR